jgi:ribonucleotide reductase beta subunit family protein with ferritin-like domain
MSDFYMQSANISICPRVINQKKHVVWSSLSHKLHVKKVEILNENNYNDFELALSLIEDNDVYENLSFYEKHLFHENILIIRTKNICSYREHPISTGKMYSRLEQVYIRKGIFITLSNHSKAYGYIQRSIENSFKTQPKFLN